MRALHRIPLTLVPLLALTACVPDDTQDSDGGADSNDSADTGADAVCTDPAAIPCEDEMYTELSLHDDMISDGDVATSADGDDFLTEIDATAGGMYESANNPWVYVKFNADGATRVDLDDSAALLSMDWDLALKRYVLRLNSGDSGPSCVGAYTEAGWTYDGITTVPSDAEYAYEDFYSDACSLRTDSVGGPETLLSTWWTYSDQNCLQTNDVAWLVQTASGRVLKLRVEAYYPGKGQEECNTDGTTQKQGGFITLRWRWMD